MKCQPISLFIAALISLTGFARCNDITDKSIKFNKPQWDSIGDLESYSYRENMLKDLIEHHNIKGLTYHQLIDSLGQPENYMDIGDRIRYDIIVNFGYLDPKSGKYLAIGFNKDSIATGFKL